MKHAVPRHHLQPTERKAKAPQQQQEHHRPQHETKTPQPLLPLPPSPPTCVRYLFLVAFRVTSDERRRNVLRTLRMLAHIAHAYRHSRSTRVAVLAHETDARARLRQSDLPARVQYMFTRSNAEYAHAWTVNRAVLEHRSAYDYIVLVHPALVCADALVHRVLREARQYEVCKCYHDVLHVDADESIADGKLDSRQLYDLVPESLRWESYDRWRIAAHLCAIRCDTFLRLRGMDERMHTSTEHVNEAFDYLIRNFIDSRGAVEGTVYLAYEPPCDTATAAQAREEAHAIFHRDYMPCSKRQLKAMLHAVPIASLGHADKYTGTQKGTDKQ